MKQKIKNNLKHEPRDITISGFLPLESELEEITGKRPSILCQIKIKFCHMNQSNDNKK